MGSPSPLARLLRVREIEEEQSRTALESALAELAQLKRACDAAGKRERVGRRLATATVGSGDVVDRIAGLEEMRSAGRTVRDLRPRITASEAAVALRRQEFLSKRTSRRQAETLRAEQLAREAARELRRGQQAVDEWYLRRIRLETGRE